MEQQTQSNRSKQEFNAFVQEISAAISGKTAMSKLHNPEPIEKISKGTVRWGEDNLYPQDLVSWGQDNPIHGGIINQKITFLSAAGAETTGPDEIVKALTAMYPDVFTDMVYFNGFSILYTRIFAGQDLWKISYLPFESVRCTDKKFVFEISDDWGCGTQSAEKTNYKMVACISRAPFSDEKEFILYARIKPKQRKTKQKKVSLGYYPTPDYSGGITSILAGIEQDYFTYSEVVNGYKGGTHINLSNGQPDTDQEADRIAKKIKDQATDRDKQGGVVVTWSDGKENAATITSLSGNDLDKRYLESNKEIKNKIMIAHSVGSPTLFGMNGNALFGSKEEMETSYTLLSNNFVTKKHNFVSEAIVSAFDRIKIPVTIKFNKYILELSQEASDGNETLRKLNSMTPLVAGKVLEQMKPDEIRALAKLLPNVQTQMKTEIVAAVANKIMLLRLSESGVKRSDIKKVHKSRTFDYQSTDEDYISAEKFADLTKVQEQILKLIADGKTFREVSKAIGKGALKLTIEILKLQKNGYLSGWTVTEKSPAGVQVLYSYEVKAGLGAAIIPTTREFCRDLVTLDRLYTRAEIEALGAELDMDVWRYRGGWYHNPKTDKTTPSCRHEWRQNIVSK